MNLQGLVQFKRADETLQTELAQWEGLRETASSLRQQILPSEEVAVDELFGQAERTVAKLTAERRFRGRLDMAELLQQKRAGPAPRWFLYNPLTPWDEVRWCAGMNIVFETWRARRYYDQVPMNLPNPFPSRTFYTAKPILLPARIRDQIRALSLERTECFVLYEPKIVRSESLPDPKPIARPDPALVVRAGGEWFVADLWDDPAIEDPRALLTLREFFVGSR